MKTTYLPHAWIGVFLLSFLGAACEGLTSAPAEGQKPAPSKKSAKAVPALPASKFKRSKELGKNVYLETEINGTRRRVVAKCKVCLRKGQLEGFMTRKDSKEHEYIVSFNGDARWMHFALLGAKAKTGTPVKFEPKFVPPTGSVIDVSIRYKTKDGKQVTVPASSWILNTKTKKDLAHPWVFAGSYFVPEEKKKQPYYAANQGDIICLINMPAAMLDLPIKNPNSDPALGNRVYSAHTKRIPPLDTPVDIILEPVPPKKK